MATRDELAAKHSRFMTPAELPDDVVDLFALTKYYVDYKAPRFRNGARVAGTGGYGIFSADGACHRTMDTDSTTEDFRKALGELLDMDLRIRNGKLAELFRDPQESSNGR